MKARFIASTLTFCLILLSFSLPSAADTLDRPKIGLVLAGGGARGAAHIGILKYLEDHRIPVDVITGTSIGAIIGGLYASGLSAREIETLLLEMDWEQALIDDVPRQDRSMQRKFREDRFSIPGTPGYQAGALKIPSGAIQGQNVILALQAMTAHVAHITDFDALPRPFKAVATDIVTGEMVVLEQGNLAVALRASMGVPAIFAPIEIDGRLLVDGGITNNLPVGLAQEMGAEVLIVVDITSPMLPREDLGNLLTITDQLTRLLVVNNTKAQKARLNERDILLIPDLEAFSAVSFSTAAMAIKVGEETIAAQQQALIPLMQSQEAYLAVTKPIAPAPKIDAIKLVNETTLADAVLRQRVFTKVGDRFGLKQIALDVNRIHGLGHFELVSFSRVQEADQTVLEISADKKAWGPNYLHFGFNLESEFKHDSRVSFLLGYSQQERSKYGAEWLTSASIGDEPSIESSLYWPLDPGGNIFGYLTGGYSDQALFDYENEHRTAVYALRGLEVTAGFGYEYQGRWRTTLGLRRTDGRAHAVSGLTRRSNLGFNESSLEWRFVLDTRDDIDFPAHGAIIDASWSLYHEAFGSENRYGQWKLRAGRYFENNQHNLGINLHLGAATDSPSINSEFHICGYGLLTGLSTQARRGAAMGVLSAIYYQRYTALPALDGLIGITMEYGGAWANTDSVSADSALGSLGAFIGADTPLGTLQIGFAIAEGGYQNYYTRLGRVF
jgi:NTE family protein